MNARDAIISIMAASPQFADLDPMVLRTIAARCRPKVFLTGDSNFGFVLPWWDRMFGTYRAEPAAGQTRMVVGIESFRTDRDLWLDRLVLNPVVDERDSRPMSPSQNTG